MDNITKQEWLEEELFVDTYGRPYNSSDVPMTIMSRKEAFEKRGYSQKVIDAKWIEVSQYLDDELKTNPLGVGFAHKDTKQQRRE